MVKNNQTLKEFFFNAHEKYKKKDFKESRTLCYKILSIDSNHFDAIVLLSNISAINRDFKEAKLFLIQALNLQPKNITILNNLGTACVELNESENASMYYAKTIKIDPKNANALYNLGLVSYREKDLIKAKNYLEKTIKFQKNFGLAFLTLGNVYLDLKNYEEAINNYKQATQINPNLITAYNNLGLAYRLLNDFKNAIISYEKAIKTKINYVSAHHNLAIAFKEIGEIAKSIKSHEMAIRYEPDNSVHYFYLSELKKDILDINLKKKIEQILKNNTSTKANIAYGNFLLSKYERNSQKYEKDLNYLTKGHNCFFESRKVKFELEVKYCFNDCLQISREAKMDDLGKELKNEIKPIFIIGVPRCGSTLVEKIIGSGSKNLPMGEETSILENFINSKILENKSLNLGEVSNIRNELSNIYRNKGLILEDCNYVFTDKTLHNFFYLNLINKIYPNAKIINCKRDPLSSIISIFQNNLTEISWAHDLDNIFKYFDNYLKIIKSFKKENANFIYELEYEKLVNNPEEESKKLMNYCDLPWDVKCLEFYKRKDLISKTASNLQIRKAIYKSSTDKYLPYKKYLNKYKEKYPWFN